MTQVASCEQALIKNGRPIQNHQIKTMLLFKTYTLEFEFDRRPRHMVCYQGIQIGIPVLLVGEFGTFEIFMQECLFGKARFFIFLQLQTSKIDRIWTDYDNILPLILLVTNQLYFDSGLFIKLKT